MNEDINREILLELKKLNEKIDKLNTYNNRGLSMPLKFIAIVVGFSVLGPLALMLMGVIAHIFQ